MSLEKIAGRDWGTFIASMQAGIPPEAAHYYSGAAEVADEHFKKEAHTKVMGFLHELMSDFGAGNTKSARHISALSRFPRDHSQHTKEASDQIFNIVRDTFVKSAYNTGLLANLSDAAIAAIGLGTAAVGAGGGAAMWHANKETSEDEAELEAKRKKIQYYRSLVDELKNRPV